MPETDNRFFPGDDSLAELRAANQAYARYIREKTNHLLEVMGTRALHAEELEDRALIDLDPIGIVARSFKQILGHLNQTIDELREAKNELQAIFDATGVGISIIDRNFVIERCNEKQREMLVDPELQDVVGHHCYEVYSNRCSPISTCPALDSFATGQPTLVREVSKKGRWFQVVTTPFARSADGEISKVIEVSMDITEKKKAEAAERELREFYLTEKLKLATVIESLSEGLLVLDEQNRIISCNRAADEITEWLATELLGQPLQSLFPALAGGACNEVRDLQGVDIPSLARDGGERRLSANIGRLLDSEGHCIGRVLTFRDNTDQKKRAELYHRTEKLAAIGQLSAGVAHELNTPLGSVLGYARLLLKDKSLGETQRGWAEIIAEQVKKSSSIIQGLLRFARQSNPAQRCLEACRLNDMITQILPVLSTELVKRKIKLTSDLQPLPTIVADPRELEQLVLNLTMNALQAIGSKGHIQIRTRHVGSRVVMMVEDDGPGIPERIRSRIFDPFYTTKPLGEGTGLGLSICSGIVSDLGGTIDVTSREGEGATFIVSLPASRNPQEMVESLLPPRNEKSL